MALISKKQIQEREEKQKAFKNNCLLLAIDFLNSINEPIKDKRLLALINTTIKN